MKQIKSYFLIKVISLLLCLLLSSSTFVVVASAMSCSVTVEFDIIAINPDNEEYTGPGFDTDGMGFTVYYGDENNLQTVSYNITGNERINDETGKYYAYVLCYGEPYYIEYYSEGSYLGDRENCWDMQTVYLKDTVMWEGSIRASAKGVSSYIAKLNLKTGFISIESGNEVAGEWIQTKTSYFLKHERVPTNTHITQGDSDYTIEKQTIEKDLWISLEDDFGINYDSDDVANLMKDSLVTVTCNFSESSEGFEFDTGHEYQKVVDYIVEPKSITATIKWVYFTYINLKLIIHPEASSDTWDEQTLSFTIKYHDLQSDKEVEFAVPNIITVNDFDVNFTLDANGGYFENGEDNVNSIAHTKKYYNEAGDYPVPVKTGYTFAGYYLTKDENLDDDVAPDSEMLTATTKMEENCTWYASWIKNEYSATFSYLNENGKRVYDEKICKYGEEYSAPEIPVEVNYKDDVLFVFTGWSPEFTGTQIMTDANLYYEAQYRTEPYIKLNEDNFYEIKTVKQILFFAEKVANGEVNANAILMNDIDLEGVAWTPIQNYSGIFDGGYNTIRNLNCISDDGNVGLFAKVTNGTVKNLHITNSSFQGSESVGAIAGRFFGNVYNCYVDHVTVTGGNSAGALIGTFDSGIAVDCYAYDDSLFGSSGNVIINDCYYLSETETEDGGKTAEQFANGEVAYLLQQANTAQVWGQDSNQEGATPILDNTGLYKVVEIGETGNYSVANVGDTNGDGTVDVIDYQALVNMTVSGGHTQTETADYDDIVKYDLDGDGCVDALDAHFMNLLINGFTTVDVYAVGDYDLNGVAFEEADIKAIKHAIENPTKLSTAEKYACDINADGKVNEEDLIELTAIYGEIDSESHTFLGEKCKICGLNKLNIADISKTVYFNDNDNKLDLSTLFTLPDGAGNVTYELLSGAGTLDGSILNIELQGTIKIKVTVEETETCSADEFEITVTVEAPKGSGSFDGEWVTIGK